jgi:hypothetical protein
MRADGDRQNLLVEARTVLLDALEALDAQRDAVVVIGAQAVYLHTGSAEVALAEATKDSDLAIDPQKLPDDPLLEDAMRSAGFFPRGDNPGTWLSPTGIPVDLIVPEALAGAGGKNARGARIPPHDKGSTRRARGLEAALIDNAPMHIHALDPSDGRTYEARVAGPAALLVAKLHKIGERRDNPRRLENKDAHDAYRLLVAIDTETFAKAFRRLLTEPLSAAVAADALGHLDDLFAAGPEALGSGMAGAAEEGVGDPEQVAVSASILSADLLRALDTDLRAFR